MKKLTWLAIVGTALLFMQVHADSVEQEVEKYIRMPPVIRLAAPVVSSDKNGREEWIGISLMGPMPDTDFYGIHCAYFIENNKNSVINGISISTYGDARLCNGLQAGLMLNESDMNGMQMALIGNQAQNVNGWQLGIERRYPVRAGQSYDGRLHPDRIDQYFQKRFCPFHQLEMTGMACLECKSMRAGCLRQTRLTS